MAAVEPNHPLAEILAMKLLSIEVVPDSEKRKMVRDAITVTVQWAHKLDSKIEQLQAENKRLRKALQINLHRCEYQTSDDILCWEVATWGVFDYDGWAEYYCDKHKQYKTSDQKAEKLKEQILAEQVLKTEE